MDQPRLTPTFARRWPGLATLDNLRRMAWGPSWRAPRLDDLKRAKPIRYDGLFRGHSLSGRSFISLGAELIRRAPIRELKLVAVAPFMVELANCPHLAGIESLDLDGNRIGPSGVRALAASPYLLSLNSLNLTRNALGGAGVRELLAARWRPQLRRLALADNDLDDETLSELRDYSNGNPALELDLGHGDRVRTAA